MVCQRTAPQSGSEIKGCYECNTGLYGKKYELGDGTFFSS